MPVTHLDFKKHAVLNAEKLTDKQVADIRKQGLIVIHRPDNIIALKARDTRNYQQLCVSPEAA